MSKVLRILKTARGLDRRLARTLRKEAVREMIGKKAEDQHHGIFQNLETVNEEIKRRQDVIEERLKHDDERKNYDLGPEGEESKVEDKKSPLSRSLSTRYSPDRVGVMALTRDGVQIDPITGKEYDWNSGFTTETGDKFPGGMVQEQTNRYRD